MPPGDQTVLAATAPRQDFGAVGGSHDDDTALCVKAVHLDEELIQRLFALVIARQPAHSPGPAQCIQLVDENYAGCEFLRLLEQIADTGGADTHKHFHELGTTDRQKRHGRLPRDRLG